MIIDSHMHLFTAQSEEFPRGVHDLYPPDRKAEIAEYLSYADEVGVRHSVLVSLDEHDDYVAHALREHPGRFSAVAVMDNTAHDPREDFRQRLGELPLVGFRVWTLGADESLVVPDQFLDLLSELESAQVAAWFYSDETQLRALAGIVDRFPDLTIVLNHLGFCQSGFACDEWGRPRIETAIPPASLGIVEELAQAPNVVTMFSGHYAFSNESYPYADLKPISNTLLSAFGAERLLWASDWPWIKEHPGYGPLKELVALQLPELSTPEIDQILGGNAQRILGIEVETAS